MGVLKQLINFAGSGLDYDSDKRALGVGDSANRVNVSTNEFGREFVISNMKGTTEKSHSFTHDGSYSGATYTVIGSCYDDNRDAVYIFIYSDLTNHSILRFNYSDDSFDKIAWDNTKLGLDVGYPLTDLYMIGDILHWNPRTTSPRSINVQWAYYDWISFEHPQVSDPVEWNIGDYVKQVNKVYKIIATGVDHDDDILEHQDKIEFMDWTYQDIYTGVDDLSTYIIRRERDFYNTPLVPYSGIPYTAIEDDTDITVNSVRGNIFQFAYRFYVPGHGYTISSSFSNMIVNQNDEWLDGELIDSITNNNVIEVGFQTGVSGDNTYQNGNWLWEFAEILFRKNNDTQWYVADKIYHNDIGYANKFAYSGAGGVPTVCTTYFYNNRIYEPMDSAAIEKPYNALPILANSQWPLDGERSAYGGITEGFDALLRTNIELTAGNRLVGLSSGSSGVLQDTITFTVVKTEREHGSYIYDYTSGSITLNPSGSSPWTIRFTMYGQIYEGAYTGSTAAQYRAALIEVMNQSPIMAYDNGSNQIEFGTYDPYDPILKTYDGATYSTAVIKVGSFKTNTEHALCLYYYDSMLRRSDPSIQIKDNYGGGSTVFIPSLPDDGVLTQGTNHQQYINWEISHDAPSWAKYWRWGYAGNQSISLFWQYNIEGITLGADALAGYALVDISGLQTISDSSVTTNDNTHVNSNISSYYYEPGDRVRFITQHTGSATDTTDLTLADPKYDYEIKGYDDANHIIYLDSAAADTSPYTDYNGDETVIEIYRPSKDADNLEYYEKGPLYDVYESGGRYFHKGPVQDQTSSLPATGEISEGDVYLITRQFANGPFASTTDPVFVESYSWSDFYDSDAWGQGKIGIISGIGQVDLNNVRYSNRYSPNTLSSGVSEFDALDYKPLSNENGKITAMRQAGHVLKVYFERNSASVMVNKAQFLDADGISQIVKSDLVLGTVEYSNYHYGTIFPESVYLIDRTVYFYDIYRKSYVRDSSNGVFAISDYRAVSKFDEISEALLSSGVDNVQVWTGYDPERKFVYVMVKDSNTPANDLVMVFNEKKDRWECTIELTQGDLLRATARDLISFIGENLYIHNDTENRGYFYDGYHGIVMDIVMNEQPVTTKVLDSITLNTNNEDWEITGIEIPPTPNYPNGMSSRIANEMFTIRENGMHAEFLRNTKTHQATEELIDLRNGDVLRGQTATITLENAATSEVVLFDVIINMSPSKI